MSKKNNIDYGIGNTRVDSCFKLAKFLGLPGNLYLKREDTNPTGSHKDRCFSVWINSLKSKVKSRKLSFAISSSGNAAIAAAACCVIGDYPLKIYLSDQGEKKKQWRLEKLLEGKLKVGKWPFKSLAVNLQQYSFDEIKDGLKIVKQREIDDVFKKLVANIKIVKCKKPKKEAMMASKEEGMVNLRGSMDDLATLGYEKIAEELAEQVQGLSDFFIPVSSGTAAVGIYNGFKKLKESGGLQFIPKFHICQTQHVHTLIRNIATQNLKPKTEGLTSIVPAICDRIGYRRKQVEKLVKKTQSSGLIMTDKEIRNALYTANKFGQKIGKEAGLALAGVKKAREQDVDLGDKVVVLVTGI